MDRLFGCPFHMHSLFSPFCTKKELSESSINGVWISNVAAISFLFHCFPRLHLLSSVILLAYMICFEMVLVVLVMQWSAKAISKNILYCPETFLASLFLRK